MNNLTPEYMRRIRISYHRVPCASANAAIPGHPEGGDPSSFRLLASMEGLAAVGRGFSCALSISESGRELPSR